MHRIDRYCNYTSKQIPCRKTTKQNWKITTSQASKLCTHRLIHLMDNSNHPFSLHSILKKIRKDRSEAQNLNIPR